MKRERSLKRRTKKTRPGRGMQTCHHWLALPRRPHQHSTAQPMHYCRSVSVANPPNDKGSLSHNPTGRDKTYNHGASTAFVRQISKVCLAFRGETGTDIMCTCWLDFVIRLELEKKKTKAIPFNLIYLWTKQK